MPVMMPTAVLPAPAAVTATDGPAHVSTDISAAEWNAFVREHPDATGYHRWEWRDVFAAAHRYPMHYLAARQNGRVTGVLPLAEIRSRLFGRALSSLPYVNYGGVLSTTDAAGLALVAEAERLARRLSSGYVVLRHRRRQFDALPWRGHKVTMLLPLEQSTEAMWTALDKKVRNQIRKAEKSGLTAASGGLELLDGFYAVFAENMRDLGTPVYGRELFARILAAFPDDARLHVVRHDGRTIAGALSYAYGDTVEVPSASSLREHRSLCPNHLMYWSIIGESIAQGRRIFDFGRSTPDDGTYHFKEQWGAAPEPLAWEYILAGRTEVPSEDRHSSKYRMMIGAWQRLPVAVATAAGPFIARAVP
jgi:serine/alanine adding enzyme